MGKPREKLGYDITDRKLEKFMATVQQLDKFLTDYKVFIKDREKLKIEHYKVRFGGLLSGYQTLSRILEKLDEREAEHFNVFQILKVQWAETRTHSPFLANLLNPRGSHGQKALFLHTFLRKFIIPAEKAEKFILENSNAYFVKEELPTGNGFIDIWISSQDQQKPFQMVIENKIYAGDQGLQMARYRNYLDSFSNSWDSKMMVYLSPWGSDPLPHSIKKEDLDFLKSQNCYKSVGYRKDIVDWLNECFHQCKSPKVQNTLLQYLQTIKNL